MMQSIKEIKCSSMSIVDCVTFFSVQPVAAFAEPDCNSFSHATWCVLEVNAIEVVSCVSLR
jgi:hypothetical protein